MKQLTLLCGCALLLFLATRAVSVRSSATITVQNADNFTTKQISLPNPLSSLIGNIADRIVLQFSDFKSEQPLTAPPAPFSSYLNSIADRIVKQYADDERKLAVAAVPNPLNGHLTAIADRTVMLYVDDSRSLPMGYPKALLGDTTPPSPPAEAPVPETSSGGTIIITWTTDEFTTFVIQIGTSSGVYTMTVNGKEFKKEHRAVLDNLPPADMYYYRIVSKDQSGNESRSPEYPLEAGPIQQAIYLPLVVR